jgi:hypothetical protein
VSGARGILPAGGTNPPDPATADMSDESKFLSKKRAMKITGYSKRMLEYVAADNPEITFYRGRDLYFHREPLMRLLLR